MKRIDDGLLLAAAAGALDPGRSRALADQLATRPAAAARLARMSSDLEPEQPVSTGWMLPPSGSWGFAAQRPFAAAPVLNMEGAQALRPGARVRLTLPDTRGIEGARLLVLWRGDGPWKCMIPLAGRPPVAVEQIPADAEGVRSIEVVMQDGAASQQWAVAVVPGDLQVDWSDEPAVAAGVLQAVSERRATLDVVRFAVALD